MLVIDGVCEFALVWAFRFCVSLWCGTSDALATSTVVGFGVLICFWVSGFRFGFLRFWVSGFVFLGFGFLPSNSAKAMFAVLGFDVWAFLELLDSSLCSLADFGPIDEVG